MVSYTNQYVFPFTDYRSYVCGKEESGRHDDQDVNTTLRCNLPTWPSLCTLTYVLDNVDMHPAFSILQVNVKIFLSELLIGRCSTLSYNLCML